METFDSNQLSGLKLLIAEDEEMIDAYITMVVRKYCTEVLHAKTGLEAVDICKNRPDLDFILMDLRMPHMDGYEATQTIREFNKNVIIIAQTAFALTGDRDLAIAAGCNDYITKPINGTKLIELLSYWNRKSGKSV